MEAGDVGHVEAVAGLRRREPARSRSPGIDDQVRRSDRRRRPVRAAARVARGGRARPCARCGSRRESRAGARPRSGRSGRWACPRRRRARSTGPPGRCRRRRAGGPGRPPRRPRDRRTASGRAGPRRPTASTPMKPMNEAATNASSTTGQRRLSGWRAPTSASARSAASVPIASASSRPRVAAHADAEPGHQVRALARERRGVGPCLGGAVGGREAARVRERHRAAAASE